MGFPYASLAAAAADCYNALYPTYTQASSATLGIQPTGVAFYTALLQTFPASNAGSLPCADALAIVASKIAQLPAPSATNIPDINQFSLIVQAIYKLLNLASYLNSLAVPLVSNAQATALLGAFNTAFSAG